MLSRGFQSRFTTDAQVPGKGEPAHGCALAQLDVHAPSCLNFTSQTRNNPTQTKLALP